MQLEPRYKTIIKTTIGVFLIIFGLAGMILPILPGWWVALVGLQLLGLKLVIDRKKPWREMIRIRNEDHK